MNHNDIEDMVLEERAVSQGIPWIFKKPSHRFQHVIFQNLVVANAVRSRGGEGKVAGIMVPEFQVANNGAAAVFNIERYRDRPGKQLGCIDFYAFLLACIPGYLHGSGKRGDNSLLSGFLRPAGDTEGFPVGVCVGDGDFDFAGVPYPVER